VANPQTLPEVPAPEHPFRYVHSSNLPALLESLGMSLLFTTYQAGKLGVVRAAQGRLSTLLRNFEQPMGLAGDSRRLAVGTRNQIWFLQTAPDLAVRLPPAGQHDSCFVPRWCHVTGDIRSHEIAWAGEELWLVNTRFSCLCTLHTDYSFVPRWQPPFISALAGEDRCHLNGLALAPGERGTFIPRFVSALGETDTAEGWRPNKARGGCLIDVATGAIVLRGLSMPHSPRWHAGRLWLLESGTGRLLHVDPAGRAETVAQLPGFTRGLAFHDQLAFVGLSRIRETAMFAGLPIADRLAELKCGIWVVDLGTGQTVALLEFEQGVEELFEIQLLRGLRSPAVIGLKAEAPMEVFVLPTPA
jgi:uncharacterized protein (TIGR03032 family)